MRTFVAAILIGFTMQINAKDLETKQTDDDEDLSKMLEEMVNKGGADELVNRMVDKLSDRVLQALPFHDTDDTEDADLDSTTLGKPGAMAMPSSRLGTVAATRPAQPLLAAGRSRPIANARQQSEELLDRRSMAGALALMAPLVTLAGEALAVQAGADNPYVAELVKRSKENKADNDAKRKQAILWNVKRFSIENYKNPQLKNVVADDENFIPWVAKVPELTKRDNDALAKR